MDRINLSKQKFEELFQTKQTLDPKDPELMSQLQRFIFGEVFYIGDLTNQQRELITCTILTVIQTLPQLKAHLNAALNVNVTPIELREAIYQCSPFIGYPKTLNAVNVFNNVLEIRGISLPLENQCNFEDNQRFEKGLKIEQELYGTEIKDKYNYLPDEYAKALPRFFTEWCFGDNYTREAMNIQTRELLIFVILVALNETNQICSHVLGNIKVGNSLDTLYATLIQCLPYLGFPTIFNALNAIKELSD